MESLLWRDATGLTLWDVISKKSKETCSFLCGGGDLLRRQPVMFSTGPEDPGGINSSLARVPGITEVLPGNGFIFPTQHHGTDFPARSGPLRSCSPAERQDSAAQNTVDAHLTLASPLSVYLFQKPKDAFTFLSHLIFFFFFLLRWPLTQALVAWRLAAWPGTGFSSLTTQPAPRNPTKGLFSASSKAFSKPTGPSRAATARPPLVSPGRGSTTVCCPLRMFSITDSKE